MFFRFGNEWFNTDQVTKVTEIRRRLPEESQVTVHLVGGSSITSSEKEDADLFMAWLEEQRSEFVRYVERKSRPPEEAPPPPAPPAPIKTDDPPAPPAPPETPKPEAPTLPTGGTGTEKPTGKGKNQGQPPKTEK